MSGPAYTRFADRAADYAQYRPSYPEQLASALRGTAALADENRAQPLAVDIGAGTGISSEFLARNGWKVIAVEPGSEMREQGECRRIPGVTFISGTAEHTGLANGSADLVTAFQSFHWFDPGPTLQEFHRLLRPGGRVALVWNLRRSANAFTTEYRELVRRLTGPEEHAKVEYRERCGALLFDCPLFQDSTKISIPSIRQFTCEELLGLARSTSYLPREGPRYQEMAAEIERLFAAHATGGTVEMTYDTDLYSAEKPAA